MVIKSCLCAYVCDVFLGKNNQARARGPESFFNLVWLSIILIRSIVMLFQASRVTAHCSKLIRSSSTIRARSMLYQELSTAELDSFIIYTSSIKMRVSCFKILFTMYTHRYTDTQACVHYAGIILGIIGHKKNARIIGQILTHKNN